MKNIVEFINKKTKFRTIMCCCGHNKYKPSLIVINTEVAEFCNMPYDIFSGTQFKHGKKRFYVKDKEGYYYIPEILKK